SSLWVNVLTCTEEQPFLLLRDLLGFAGDNVGELEHAQPLGVSAQSRGATALIVPVLASHLHVRRVEEDGVGPCGGEPSPPPRRAGLDQNRPALRGTRDRERPPRLEPLAMEVDLV